MTKASFGAEEPSQDTKFSQAPKSPPKTAIEVADAAGTGVAAKPSFLQRLKASRTIEAYLFLTVFSLSVKNFVDVKLTLVKSCVAEVGLSYEECTLLDEHSEEFKEADRIASYYIMVGSWVSTAVSMIMGILIGSFCDKYQKKVPLLLATLGFAIESAFSIFSAVFIDTPVIILAIAKVPAGIFGGIMIVISGTYAYVSQMTAAKARQIRFAILQMLLLAGITIGTVAGGWLFQEKHFVLVYGVSIGANAVGIILLALFMDNKNSKTGNMTYGEIAKAFFSFDCLKESYRLVVRPREGNSRIQLWLLIVSSFVTDIPMAGTRALVLLYVKKRYSWDTETLANVTGALRLGTAFVTIGGVRLFTKKLKWRDTIIALIGFVSLAAHYVGRGLATTGLMYSMAYVIGALNGCSKSASDNLLTRLLNEDEIGKVFVFKSLVDSTSPAVGTSFFNMVTQKFDDTIPGAMFISAGMWIAIPIMIMVWIMFFGTVPTPKSQDRGSPEATEEAAVVETGSEDETRDGALVLSDLRRTSSVCRL